MKINLLHKKLSKSLLLALAISVLSFSSVYATDFIVPDWGDVSFSNRTEASGTIQLGVGAILGFNNSTLGNDAGGRFTVTMNDSRIDLNSSSTLYVDNFSSTGSNTIVLWSSIFAADNSVLGVNELRLYGNSIFKATTFTGYSIELDDSARIEFAANVNSIATYSSTSSWISKGSSTVNTLYASDGINIEFLMTSATDTLNIGNFYTANTNDIQIGFTDEFIESIAAGAGYFDFDAYDTVVISSITGGGHVGHSVRDYSDSYTWTLTDFGDGTYRISDIVIPEPSTYAVIFGVLALGLAIYRRRK